MSTLTLPAQQAQNLSPGQFREATAQARRWLLDHLGPELADGRSTALLGTVDIWLTISSFHPAGVAGFVAEVVR